MRFAICFFTLVFTHCIFSAENSIPQNYIQLVADKGFCGAIQFHPIIRDPENYMIIAYRIDPTHTKKPYMQRGKIRLDRLPLYTIAFDDAGGGKATYRLYVAHIAQDTKKATFVNPANVIAITTIATHLDCRNVLLEGKKVEFGFLNLKQDSIVPAWLSKNSTYIAAGAVVLLLAAVGIVLLHKTRPDDLLNTIDDVLNTVAQESHEKFPEHSTQDFRDLLIAYIQARGVAIDSKKFTEPEVLNKVIAALDSIGDKKGLQDAIKILAIIRDNPNISQEEIDLIYSKKNKMEPHI